MVNNFVFCISCFGTLVKKKNKVKIFRILRYNGYKGAGFEPEPI